MKPNSISSQLSGETERNQNLLYMLRLQILYLIGNFLAWLKTLIYL